MCPRKADTSSHKQPPHFFLILNISVQSLLLLSVMLYFICMVFAEMWATGSKRKIQTKNMCLRRESNQRPLAFQHAALTTRLSRQ